MKKNARSLKRFLILFGENNSMNMLDLRWEGKSDCR
nr:MAG TPA: hypothetical protein [Caudoviricetes sp.]